MILVDGPNDGLDRRRHWVAEHVRLPSLRFQVDDNFVCGLFDVCHRVRVPRRILVVTLWRPGTEIPAAIGFLAIGLSHRIDGS